MTNQKSSITNNKSSDHFADSRVAAEKPVLAYHKRVYVKYPSTF
jgi:hypothetical protein